MASPWTAHGGLLVGGVGSPSRSWEGKRSVSTHFSPISVGSRSMRMQSPFTTLLVKLMRKTLGLPHLNYCCLPAKWKQRFTPSLIDRLLTCQRKPILLRWSTSLILLRPSPRSQLAHLMFWKPESLPLHQKVETKQWEVKRRTRVQQLLLQYQQNPLSRLKVTTVEKQASEETVCLPRHLPLLPLSSPPPQPPL